MNEELRKSKSAMKYLDSIGGKKACKRKLGEKIEFRNKLIQTHSVDEFKLLLVDLKSVDNAGKERIRVDAFLGPALLTFFATLTIVLMQFMQNFTVTYSLSIAQSIINNKIANHVILSNQQIKNVYEQAGKAIVGASSMPLKIPNFFLAFLAALLILAIGINLLSYKWFERKWFYINLLVEVINSETKIVNRTRYPKMEILRKLQRRKY